MRGCWDLVYVVSWRGENGCLGIFFVMCGVDLVLG